MSSPISPHAGSRPPARRPLDLKRSGRAGANSAPQPQSAAIPRPERPQHVRKVIAVASGKGGVGKSTVAVNLAAAFVRLGLRAGLLDADVYGPSAPTMLGVKGEPAFEGDLLVPLTAWGVKVMSIGFILPDSAAAIWRGPMADQALRAMMKSVWGSEDAPLDVLVVDLPPGTGDVQLTLVERTRLDGVVIVSTPQEIALIDARRAVAMFRKAAVPILGVVENMAWFADRHGDRIPVFGRGGAANEAANLGVPLLAEIPIEIALREACDQGRPLVAIAPNDPAAQAFLTLARRLA